jgi:hypothetical protein
MVPDGISYKTYLASNPNTTLTPSWILELGPELDSQCHIPKHCNFYIHYCENLKSCTTD